MQTFQAPKARRILDTRWSQTSRVAVNLDAPNFKADSYASALNKLVKIMDGMVPDLSGNSQYELAQTADMAADLAKYGNPTDQKAFVLTAMRAINKHSLHLTLTSKDRLTFNWVVS